MARYLFFIIAAHLAMGAPAFGVTLEDLQNNPKLTPKRFAGYFGNFDFEYHPEIQKPEVFLSRQAGDCADYATLADRVLRPKGYHTRLIYVGLNGAVAHTVCYVAEEKGYLDFNNRACVFKIEHCAPSVAAIADQVAKSFRLDWGFASEFTYAEGKQHFNLTISKARGGKPGGTIKIYLTGSPGFGTLSTPSATIR